MWNGSERVRLQIGTAEYMIQEHFAAGYRILFRERRQIRRDIIEHNVRTLIDSQQERRQIFCIKNDIAVREQYGIPCRH
ncbi:hypothetical protein D3C77_669780 [compost metagenome]